VVHLRLLLERFLAQAMLGFLSRQRVKTPVSTASS
jgi:hypothetical protein